MDSNPSVLSLEHLEQMRLALESERKKSAILQEKLEHETKARKRAEVKLSQARKETPHSPIALAGRVTVASSANLSPSSGNKLSIQERLMKAEIERENAQSELTLMKQQLEALRNEKRSQPQVELCEEDMNASLMRKLQDMMQQKGNLDSHSRSSSVSGEISASSSVVLNRDDDTSSVADSAISVISHTATLTSSTRVSSIFQARIRTRA